MIEQVAGQRLAAGPGEGPEGRRQGAAGKRLFGGLPDRRHLGGEVEPDLRYQRRREDRRVALDKKRRIHGSEFIRKVVTPARAGVQGSRSDLRFLDTSFRGYDG